MNKKNIIINIFIVLLINIIFPTNITAKTYSTYKEDYSIYNDYYIFEQGSGSNLGASIKAGNPYVSLNYAVFARTNLDDANVKYKRELKEICVAIPLPSEGSDIYKTYYGRIRINGSERKPIENESTINKKCAGFWTIEEYYTHEMESSQGDEKTLYSGNIGIFSSIYGISSVCSRIKCVDGKSGNECKENGAGEINRYIKHYGNIAYTSDDIFDKYVDFVNNSAAFCTIDHPEYCKINGVTEETKNGKTTKTINCKASSTKVDKKKDTTGSNNNESKKETVTTGGENVKILLLNDSVKVLVKNGNSYIDKTLGIIYLNGEQKFVELNSNKKVKVESNHYYEYIYYEDDPKNFGTSANKCSAPIKDVTTSDGNKVILYRDYFDNWDGKKCSNPKNILYLYPEYASGSRGDWYTTMKDGDNEWPIPVLEKVQIATNSVWEKEIKEYNNATITTRERFIVSQKVSMTDVEVKRDGQVFGIARLIDADGMQSKFGAIDLNNIYNGGNMPAVILSKVIPDCIDKKPDKKSLTCHNFEAIFEHAMDDDDDTCVIFVSSETDATNHTKVLFKQKGILKLNLGSNYIKSGESFTIKAEYTDTIKVEYFDTKGKIDSSILTQLKQYIDSAELFKKFNSELKYDGITLAGVWTYKVGKHKSTTNASTAADNLAEDLLTGKSKTVSLTYKFELLDAWSNSSESNYIKINDKKIDNYAGVAHMYTNTNPSSESTLWTNEGKRFYTRLNSETKKYDITWNIKGLSAIHYKYENESNDNYFWEAEYECNINCHQQFYNKGSKSGEGESGFKFSYREVDYHNPFPVAAGTIDASYSMKQRYIGLDANWITWATAIGAKDLKTLGTIEVPEKGLVKIEERLGNRYSTETNKDPDYVIKINSNGIKNIQNYNINNNYYEKSDFIAGKVNGEMVLKYSGFLGNAPDGMSVKRNSKMIINPIGTCGKNRGESILSNSCFCMLIDSSGNCIYNRNFTLE